MEKESDGGPGYQEEARRACIIEMREHGYSYLAIAAVFRITRERVRQIEQREIARVKREGARLGVVADYTGK